MSSEAAGYLFGHTIGAYLFPLIGVFLYYKIRRKRPTPTHRIVVISLWTLGLALLAASGERNLSRPLTQEEKNRRMGELAKEGAGQAPLSANQTKWDGPLRSFFADIKSSNEAYQKEIAQTDVSALKNLYTAGSFKSPENIAAILSQLRTTMAVDDKYASMQPMYNKLKERIFAVDASQSEKESFWRGFESSSRPGNATRDAAIAKEREWIQASIDLYEFAQSHQGSYSLRGGKLTFKGTGLAPTFNEKLHKATQLRTQFSTTQAAFDKSQGESLDKFGLQRSDLSVPGKK